MLTKVIVTLVSDAEVSSKVLTSAPNAESALMVRDLLMRVVRELPVESDRELSYVIKDSSICPYCGSDQISGTGGIDINDDMAINPITCLDCGEGWTDDYILTGITKR